MFRYGLFIFVPEKQFMHRRLLTADEVFDGKQLWSRAVIVLDEQGYVESFIPHADAQQRRAAEYFSGLLCPGFINVHCHSELAYLKDQIPRGTGLVDFILTLMDIRHSAAFSAKTKFQAIARADELMYQAGIVAVGDIVNTTDSLPVKQSTSLYYHHFVECMGVPDAIADARWEQAQQLLSQWTRQTAFPASLTPHAPYSVSDTLFQRLAHQSQTLISFHNQESAAENEWFLSGQGELQRLYDALQIAPHAAAACGTTSLQHVLPFFSRANQQVILVHNTFTPATDIQWATQSFPGQLYWCLCPKANLYIEQQLPPVEPLLAYAADRIVIGTDSLASNDSLSVLEELKCLQQHFPFLALENLLRWATWNGARALQCDSWLGSFTPGKKPGVVHISAIQDQRLTPASQSQRIA